MKFQIVLTCFLLLSLFSGCGKKGTCSDGRRSPGEKGIDCGGPCNVCITCNDGIQNQGETGTDCGGPCSACPVIYPGEAAFGANLLHPQADSVFHLGSFDLAANIPANSTVLVRMYWSSASMWTLAEKTQGWQEVILGTSQEFYASGQLKSSRKIGVVAPGTATLQVFENNVSVPVLTKTLYFQ